MKLKGAAKKTSCKSNVVVLTKTRSPICAVCVQCIGGTVSVFSQWCHLARFLGLFFVFFLVSLQFLGCILQMFPKQICAHQLVPKHQPCMHGPCPFYYLNPPFAHLQAPALGLQCVKSVG